MIDEIVDVDEEAAAALVRAYRTRTALRQAGDLAAHLRSMLEPSDGRTEGGLLREWRSPLLTDVADAADELFVVLVDWATWWARVLDEGEPAALAFARRNYQDSHVGELHLDAPILGFRAGTSPEMAAALIGSLTTWLIRFEEAIAAQDRAWEYQDEVTSLVWGGRAAAGLTRARPQREPMARPCPACGDTAVRAEFFGGSFRAAELRGDRLLSAVEGIEVRCSTCGHVEEASVSKIARWIS